VRWRRADPASPVFDRTDVDTVFAVLFDILHVLRSIEALLEDGDDPEEVAADDDS